MLKVPKALYTYYNFKSTFERKLCQTKGNNYGLLTVILFHICLLFVYSHENYVHQNSCQTLFFIFFLDKIY